MTDIHAKPVVDGVLWVVEQDGVRVGTLHKKENNHYMFSTKHGELFFNKKSDVTRQFGKEFFLKDIETTVSKLDVYDCHGYPTKWKPHKSMYNIRKRLPLFTKSNQSKSLFCAGYYIIKFPKNWVRSFCPKLITIERYPYHGPFKTEDEAKESMINAK
jgi:hypothetical protein